MEVPRVGDTPRQMSTRNLPGGSVGGPGGVPGVGANTPRDHPGSVGGPGGDIYILLEPVDLHLAPFGRPFDSNSHPFGSLRLTFPICSSPRGSIF